MIRQTSILAYRDISEDGTALSQKEVILNYIKNYSSGLTRNDISLELSIKINAVCGRTRELIKAGLVEEIGKRHDPFTNKLNMYMVAK